MTISSDEDLFTSFLILHSGPGNLKKSRPKNLVKSNTSISQKKICNFKNGQKSIFELGKSLKLSKMQFHEKKFAISKMAKNQFLYWGKV